MDPVNKWLTTIILFMMAVLLLMWNVAGAGRYEFTVKESTLFDSYVVVYILDTKDGEVKAQLVNEDNLHYKNIPKIYAQKILSYKKSTYRNRGY